MCILHKWLKWEEVGSGTLSDNKYLVGFYIKQKRICEKCGKVQIRLATVRGD